MLRTVLNNRHLFWTILAVPAMFMLSDYVSGTADAMDLLHPTGETSARLMIAAMLIGPLIDIFGRRRWLSWLQQRRRALGVAAFSYAALHLAFYVIDMGEFADMLGELDAPGIWTGWLAILALLVPALASNQVAVRLLRRNWKRAQQVAYAAALLTLAHWLFIAYNLGPALVQFAPLMVLTLIRFLPLKRKSS